jgi:hypothetical protein
VNAGSNIWTVFARSNAGIVGSNFTQGLDNRVHLFCVCAVQFVDIGFTTGWSPVKGVLPTVYKLNSVASVRKNTTSTAACRRS